MITPALVILLMVIGWSSAAFAMLWGMLRVTRHHLRTGPEVKQSTPGQARNNQPPQGITLST